MSFLALLVHPIQIGHDPVYLVLPLLAAVAIVYKTIRVKYLRDLPVQVLILWGYMAIGLAVLTAALYVLGEHVA